MLEPLVNSADFFISFLLNELANCGKGVLNMEEMFRRKFRRLVLLASTQNPAMH